MIGTSTQKDSKRLQEPPPKRWDPTFIGQRWVPHPDRGDQPGLKALVWFWIIDETLSTNLYTKCV